jgi:type II secretory pathway pseudopilin PulG
MRNGIMNNSQRGITLIETLGALAIGTMLLVGLSAMVDASLDDMQGQQASLYQSQVSAAARRYLSANYQALVNATAGQVVAVDIDTLKNEKYLPDRFAPTNAYSQGTCVLIRQAAPGKLDALVVTSGGKKIADKQIAAVAANAGQGGGYIAAVQPAVARGASWNLLTTAYRGVACPGSPAAALTGAADDAGHLVTAIFHDGADTESEFVHRKDVAGRPELNRMTTTLQFQLGTNAQAVADTSDVRCQEDAHIGKIAVDASGQVLSCQDRVWRRQGNGHWKDPSVLFTDLPATGNDVGDVRMVTSLARAFMWKEVTPGVFSWAALAVDEKGDLAVPGTVTTKYLQLNYAVVKNTACSANGLLAKDATGLLLTCQSGLWRSLLDTRLVMPAILDRDFWLRPADGPNSVTDIPLASLAGPRPLYITGYGHCRNTGNGRALVYVELWDASGNILAYTGGCGSNTTAPYAVWTKGFIGLQKIPENATFIRIGLESGSAPSDYGHLKLMVYGSN